MSEVKRNPPTGKHWHDDLREYDHPAMYFADYPTDYESTNLEGWDAEQKLRKRRQQLEFFHKDWNTEEEKQQVVEARNEVLKVLADMDSIGAKDSLHKDWPHNRPEV